jgi:hypothetical protein
MSQRVPTGLHDIIAATIQHEQNVMIHGASPLASQSPSYNKGTSKKNH